MQIKSIFTAAVAATAILALPISATAATLTGDTVTVTFNNGRAQTFVVGQGSDATFGSTDFDLDGGGLGTEFLVNVARTFEIFGGGAGFTISDLNFSDGEILVGFDLTTTVFQDTVVSFTKDSLTIDFTDGPNGPDVVLAGTFITAVAPVPLPAGMPLALAGFGLLGLLKRRQRRQV